MALVQFKYGSRAGESVPLEKDKTIVGRHKTCDCVIMHPMVSRKHFCVERNAGKFFLVDLESGNGTLVNGSRVTWVELSDGDNIQVGPFTLVFSSSEPSRVDTPVEEVADSTSGYESRGFDANHERIYPREYLAGIAHFNRRRYYEAHEVWEEIWLRSEGDTKTFYQMLIQAAVGLHHYEHGNARGGRGMHRNVNEKRARLGDQFMSLEISKFVRQFNEFFADLVDLGLEAAPGEERARPLIVLDDVAVDD
jgi:uncharacterized protein